MKFFKTLPFRFWVISASCIIIIFFSYFRIFHNYELISYDLRLRLRHPLAVSKNIVVIEISDDTLNNLGQWPLPRDFHASLVDVLKECGAKAVVFDILFSESAPYDEIFSQSIKGAGNVYLPCAFLVHEPLQKNHLPLTSSNILAGISGGLQRYYIGQGHINTFVDPDGKTRRIPLFVRYQDSLFMHLGLKVACDWLGLDNRNIKFQKDRVIIDNKLSLPVTLNTSFLVNYPGKWANSFLHLSYFQILKAYNDRKEGFQPRLDLSILKNKVCFVGLTAVGTADLKPTPLENIYPMLGLQASVFNSVLNRKFITDIGPFFNTLINLIVFLISLIICLRFLPLKAFIASVILGFSYFLVSAGLFISYGIWMDLFFPLVIIGLTYAGSMLYRFLEEARKRVLLEGELDIARTIQQSFLPAQIKEFCGLTISAFIQPAKFVAGDLYDIVAIDDKRLGVFIGDVSGKGVPASLIMAQTISLFRVFSRQFLSCPDVLKRLNKELCGKFEGRFVTAIYMTLDSQRHKICVSSAGHTPLLFYSKKDNLVLEANVPAGLPLGIMEEAEYQDATIDLEKGDRVVLFTDGLSEARNRKCQEFGVERIKNIISQDTAATSEKILERMKEEVLKFSHRCPQHDDITIIVISACE